MVRWRKILCQGFLFFMHDDLFVKTMLHAWLHGRHTPFIFICILIAFFGSLASRSVRDFVAGAGDFQQLTQSDKSAGCLE